MIIRLFFILCLSVFPIVTVNAQDWKSVLKGVASSVGKEVGEKVSEKVKTFSIEGDWTYTKPECQFTSEDGSILAKAGSEIISNKIEGQITRVMDKLGIDSTSVFTFAADSTYSIQLGKRTVRGTYSINKETKEIVLTSRLQKTHTAKITQNILEPDKVILLFNADKLMNFVQNVSDNLSKTSTNSTVQAVNSVLKQYDGLMLGYELKKKKVQDLQMVAEI